VKISLKGQSDEKEFGRTAESASGLVRADQWIVGSCRECGRRGEQGWRSRAARDGRVTPDGASSLAGLGRAAAGSRRASCGSRFGIESEGKKRLYWHSCYGEISVIEQLYRRGRGGKQIRPFVEGAAIRCREYSQPLQRVLTDFGAESSFGRAVERLKEHYGIEVPSGAVRQITEQHAEVMLKQQQVLRELSEQGSQSQIIGEIDGSMVPLVAVKENARGDRRKTRTVNWQEARLALARLPGSVTARFGATMGAADQAGDQLRDCVIRLGGGSKTKIHGVGDGASWIAEQVERCFGTQGS
jgi:hypothetical protein